MTQSPTILQSIPRVVLFTTAVQHIDIPGDDNVLACLLPLGSATFIQRVLDSCALAGVSEVDLVVSEQPEMLRKILHDGGPWGIRLNWHYAKDTASPYKVLRGMGLHATDRVVIGHAHQWVASRVIRELMRATGVALNVGDALLWAGWFSTDVSQVFALSPNEDYASLAMHVKNMGRVRCVIATNVECAQVLGADELLRAQKNALDGSQESAIPASWRRFPWGAASPDAVIDANAKIEGPVLIGPGSMVEGGAELGPDTVLARNVIVARGAKVRNSLVMSNTYVGGQITLENSLAQGNSIQSLKWSVRNVLSTSDALLTSLRPSHTTHTPAISRFMAGILATLMLPPFVVCVLAQRLSGGASLWKSVNVVKARLKRENNLECVTVRLACDNRVLSRIVALYGGLLDIIQGRRNWFGLRPRRKSEWYALGRDWQTLFGRTAIGLFHAKAWEEGVESLNLEADAAADAFMAVQSTLTGRIHAVFAPIFR
jgi:hypothetical protein